MLKKWSKTAERGTPLLLTISRELKVLQCLSYSLCQQPQAESSASMGQPDGCGTHGRRCFAHGHRVSN
eukprot:5036608-Amphidinium_carterae.1